MKTIWNKGDSRFKLIEYLEENGGSTPRQNLIKQCGFDVVLLNETLKDLEEKGQIDLDSENIHLKNRGNFTKRNFEGYF